MRLIKEMTLTRFLASFSNEKLSDQIFYLTFYVCVGLLPASIGFFGHKALQLPLILIGALVLLRVFMRPDCRERMRGALYTPAALLLAGLLVLLLVYAVSGYLADADRLRLFGKPVTISLAGLLLLFCWSHQDLIDRQLMAKMMYFGILAGLAGLLVIFIWGYYLYFFAPDMIPRPVGPFAIHNINDELKILFVFVFFAAAGQATSQRLWGMAIAFPLFLIAISYFTMGSYIASNGELRFGHFHSETVQFGGPLALAVLALAYLLRRFASLALFTGAAFVLVNAPWIFRLWFRLIENLPLPRAHELLVRAEIWDGVAKKILEAPLLGYGLDASRYDNIVKFDNIYQIRTALWHPHNMFLQLWLDTGLLGVLIAVGLFFLGWRVLDKMDFVRRPPVLAGLVMLGVFMLVTHSLWQTWSMALIVFVVAQISLLPEKGVPAIRPQASLVLKN